LPLRLEDTNIAQRKSENPKSKVKVKRKLRKYIDAKNNGTLKDMLKE
jgi:hypothetical protein